MHRQDLHHHGSADDLRKRTSVPATMPSRFHGYDTLCRAPSPAPYRLRSRALLQLLKSNACWFYEMHVRRAVCRTRSTFLKPSDAILSTWQLLALGFVAWGVTNHNPPLLNQLGIMSCVRTSEGMKAMHGSREHSTVRGYAPPLVQSNLQNLIMLVQ